MLRRLEAGSTLWRAAGFMNCCNHDLPEPRNALERRRKGTEDHNPSILTLRHDSAVDAGPISEIPLAQCVPWLQQFLCSRLGVGQDADGPTYATALISTKMPRRFAPSAVRVGYGVGINSL